MKKTILLSICFFMVVCSLSGIVQANNRKAPKNVVIPKLEVYYFHFSVRCTTCHAVEDNSKSALTALYPENVKTGEYVFKAINLDDATSKPIAKKLGVGGQTLLVVHGDVKIDLTSKAFLYAQDPIRIKAEIKKAVEKVLH
jgi:hypothetical protein